MSSTRISKLLRPNDIVIPVMGQTGAGKSTFINAAMRRDVTQVGHGSTSCTKQPLPIIVDPIPNRPDLSGHRLVLLDTPGFDDTHEDDVAILKRIARWLEDSRKKGARVGGSLYLHNISHNRFTGTERQNLLMFSRLCGKHAIRKAVLVTTHWPSGPSDVLDRRDEERKDQHWKTLIDEGLRVRRFQRDYSSAWDVINTILPDINCLDLRIQTELGELQMAIPETEAGQELRRTLKQFLKQQNEALVVEEDYARTSNREAPANSTNIRAKIAKLRVQINSLKIRIPFPRRILNPFR